MAPITAGPLVTAGTMYGRWKALENQDFIFVKKVWAKCECGTKRKVRTDNLRAGRTSSCGCLTREIAAIHGLKRRKLDVQVGYVFGRLTVLDVTSFAAIKCQCTCGNIVYPSSGALVKGNTASCGCLKRDTSSALGKRRAAWQGASKHELYSAWRRVHGGKYPTFRPWKNDPYRFYRDVEKEIGPRPEGLYFMMKDEAVGYRPGNICWRTRCTYTQKYKVPVETRQEIIELVEQGFLKKEIAEAYGISRSTVTAICKEHAAQQ